ncbi:MAG: polysaccharide export protein [Lachnospiraceae bacterium]|nr:polysaccharide export protein [Lachnospiraceae bacterium]
MNPATDEIEIDLLEIFYVIRSKMLIILASMIAFGGIMFGYSTLLAQPIYESTARMYILTQSTSITSLADIQVGTSLTQDYKVLITSRTVVEQVIENLQLDCTYGQMLEQVSVNNPSNTRIIEITIQDNIPEDAKLIVDEFVEVSREKISDIMVTDAPSVVDYGNMPVNPVSPNIMKNTVIGAALGAFLAIAIVIVIFLMDDTVKTADDVEKYLGLNTLTSVPLKEGEKKAKKKKFLPRKGGKR